jgi:small GTP-binding protein
MLEDRPQVKAVLIGDSRVGKTSLLERMKSGAVRVNPQLTIGGACALVSATLEDGSALSLVIWDTAGQEKYRGIVPLYFSNAAVVVVVYDVTNDDSFANINDWVQLAGQNAPEDACFLLVGNKIDLATKIRISPEAAAKKAGEMRAHLVQASALTGEGIADLLSGITRAASSCFQTATPDRISLDAPGQQAQAEGELRPWGCVC